MSTTIALFNIIPSVWLYQIASANDKVKDKQKSRTTKSFTHIFFEENQKLFTLDGLLMFYKMIRVRVVQKRGIVAPLLRGIVALLFWSQPQGPVSQR